MPLIAALGMLLAPASRAATVAAGKAQSCAIFADGKLLCWGSTG